VLHAILGMTINKNILKIGPMPTCYNNKFISYQVNDSLNFILEYGTEFISL